MRFQARIFNSLVLALALLAIVGSECQAADDMSGGFVSALVGATNVNNNGGTNGTYGLGAGYKFAAPWSVGLDYTTNTFTVATPWTANLTMALGTFKYYFTPAIAAGVKLGVGNVNYSGTNAPTSTSSGAYGPTVSYLYHFDSSWSVTGEGSLLFINNTPGVSAQQVLAKFHYWF